MSSVHRLLDEAFAGAPLTAEVQDLKEEVRAGLLDRAAELEASGLPASEAAHRAVAELGDVGALVTEVTGTAAPASTTSAPTATRLALQHRVGPRPGFVLGVVVSGLVVVGALVLAGLAAGGVLGLPAPAVVAVLTLAASAAGFVVGSSVAQETTTLHPVPATRAGGYYLATGLAVLGLLVAVFTAVGTFPRWVFALAGLGVVASAGVFVWLGVTQTNRKKAWVRELDREHQPENGFTRDPASAARFGIYAGVIWVSAALVAGVVGPTLGWRWSWVPLVAAWAVMMVVLARMLFGTRRER